MTLTTQPVNAALDLVDGYGQQSTSFRFRLLNGASGLRLGDLTPVRAGNLAHSTSRTVKRSLTLTLGVTDAAAINPISDRLDVAMVINDVEYPLGRFVFTDFTTLDRSSGDLAQASLTDEMYIIDQEIELGISARGRSCSQVIVEVLADYDFPYDLEPSDFISAESWTAGTRRGTVLSTLAVAGDYFTPWFSNNRTLTFIRSVDPATQVPAFNLDAGHQVYRQSITTANDLLSAPNRFVVVSNAATDGQAPVFASVDIATTAPHSIPNRGFVIPQVVDLQLTTSAQAAAVARQLAQRSSVLEYVNLTTSPDPRHDSYDVVFWDGQLWLETAWSLQLSGGGAMTHTLSKVYS